MAAQHSSRAPREGQRSAGDVGAPRSALACDSYADEAELLAGLLRREPAAWRAFHARYDRLVFRCIHEVLRPFAGRLGSDAAREVHATFLLSLHQRDMHKLRVFDPSRGRTFSSWLGRLATNCAIDHVRKHGRRAPIELDDAPEEPVAQTPDPYDAVESQRRLAIVRAAVAQLTLRDRELLSLTFVEGLSPEAVASRMGVSVKTVYSKSHKIREKLKCALERAELACAA